MFTKLKYTFIGRPLKSLTEGEGGLLGKTQALAMLSSDALSSIAYGPEQVVLVLASLSPLAIWWSLPIGIFVLLLLASLTISIDKSSMPTLKVEVPIWLLEKTSPLS